MRTQIVVLAILTLAFALGAAVMPAMASGDVDRESTGNFTLNNAAPTVTLVELNNAAKEAGALGGMTPDVQFSVKMTVGDTNTLDDLHNITVTLRTNETLQTAADSQSHKATYQWNHANGWTKTGPADGWSAPDGTSTTPTLSGVSDTIWLVITPSMVANESVATCCDWDIYVKAVDNSSDSGDMLLEDRTMDWYGALSVAEGSFYFPTLTLNTQNTAMHDGHLTLTSITNGYYQLESRTGTWTNTTYNKDVNLENLGSPGDHEFSLKCNVTGTTTSASFVTNADTDINGYTYVAPPSAITGNTNDVYLWVDVGTKILPYDYSGTYYVTVLTS